MQSPDAETIRRTRKAAGLTQAQSAELVHMTLNGWHKTEAGSRRLSPAHWDLYCRKTGFEVGGNDEQ